MATSLTNGDPTLNPLGIENSKRILTTSADHRNEIHKDEKAAETPNYSMFQYLVVSGEKCSEKFLSPKGISVHKDTGTIYIADMENSRVMIFSRAGNFLKNFGSKHLLWPWGSLIFQDRLYISDCGRQGIFMFTLPDLKMVERVGTEGCGDEEFNCPRQLSVSPTQLIYVADEYNNRIQILDFNLKFQSRILNTSLTRPIDIKFTHNEMLVLNCIDSTCVHIFTLSGEKLRSIITRGFGMQVRRAYFFCLDADNNIIISDYSVHRLKVFSPEGQLLDIIGKEGDKPGMFYHPTGIAILQNEKLVSVSENSTFALQILST